MRRSACSSRRSRGDARGAFRRRATGGSTPRPSSLLSLPALLFPAAADSIVAPSDARAAARRGPRRDDPRLLALRYRAGLLNALARVASAAAAVSAICSARSRSCLRSYLFACTLRLAGNGAFGGPSRIGGTGHRVFDLHGARAKDWHRLLQCSRDRAGRPATAGMTSCGACHLPKHAAG